MNDLDDEPGNFSIRFSPEAQADAILIASNMPTPQSSRSLYEEFGQGASQLAYLPERHAIESDVSARLGMTLRRIRIRRWNLYYEVLPDTDDGPLVRIVFIRDARLPVMTQDEADRIKDNQ